MSRPSGDGSFASAGSTLGERVLVGVLFGLAFAVVYSVVAALIYLGATLIDVFSGSRLAETDLPLIRVVLAYFAGGALAGCLIGALFPYSRGRLGSILVGILGAIPVFSGFMLIDNESTGAAGIASVLISSVLLGGILGYQFLYKPEE